MLRFALIEIRASEKIENAKKIADIFHNLPSQLMSNFDEEQSVKAYELITKKARRYKMEDYITSLVREAKKSINNRV